MALLLNPAPATKFRTPRNSILMPLWLGITFLSLFIGPSPAACADQRAQISAVLLLDSSGSMKHTDPKRLRVPAAQMFVSLLDGGDRAGLASFSDQGYPIVRLTKVDADGRRTLLTGAEKVSSKGAYTNLYAALETGISLLGESNSDGVPRYLILLSDGHMDTGDAAQDRALTKRLQEGLLPALRQQGIKVYSIAFTRESDTNLLQAIATDSGGVFQLIEDQSGLHDAFAEIFENAKSPNMLAVDGGQFQVDDSIREITIVAPHAQHGRVRLRDPADGEIDKSAHPDTVRWMHSASFDLITIPSPKPGTWHLITDQNDNRAYVVTDLELVTDLKQNQFERGKILTLQAWMTDKGQRLLKPEVLASTEFLLQLQWADGRRQSIALSSPGADGAATAQIPLNQAGAMQLTLYARSTTFERHLRRHIQVVPGVASASAPGRGTPSFVPPPIRLPIPEAPVIAPPTQRPAANPISSVPQPTAQTPKSKPLSFSRVLLWFIVANGILAIIVGGVLLLAQRRRSAADHAAQTAED